MVWNAGGFILVNWQLKFENGIVETFLWVEIGMLRHEMIF
jgi:hypothetical protein